MIPGLTIIPEVAFTAVATGFLHFDDPVKGKLDTAKLAGPDTFTDLVDYFRGGEISRGVSAFDGVYGRAEAGTCTMRLANEDRRFDPSHLTGPYVVAGVTQVEPERQVRIRASYGGVAYNLFRGFADDWSLSYVPPAVANAVVKATDGTKVIANYDQNAGGIVGTGEDSGARIARVLDNIGWAADDRDLDVGLTTLQGTDLSANAWAEIALVSDTELGDVYFDGTGKLVFRNRQAALTDARSNTSQATFGDANDGVEIGYVGVKFGSTSQQLRNVVRATRVGGTQQIATDGASVSKYRARTWQRSDLIMQTDAAAADYALYVLGLLKTAELRFDTLVLNPLANPDVLFPQVLGRELGDRITIRRRPPGGGATIERQAFIRGIQHSIELDTWQTTWTLQDATTKFAFLVLDNATLGRLDYNALAY